jgi:hypothetical protein
MGSGAGRRQSLAVETRTVAGVVAYVVVLNEPQDRDGTVTLSSH